jgi:hypothetical protein
MTVEQPTGWGGIGLQSDCDPGSVTRFPIHLPSPSNDRIMTERTKYQQNIIKNYYENRENISLQRAQEILTDLYLSEGKKRQKYWESLTNHLSKLGVKPEVLKRLVAQDDAQAAATLITNLGKDS